jgi:hypothetical protein
MGHVVCTYDNCMLETNCYGEFCCYVSIRLIYGLFIEGLGIEDSVCSCMNVLLVGCVPQKGTTCKKNNKFEWNHPILYWIYIFLYYIYIYICIYYSSVNTTILYRQRLKWHVHCQASWELWNLWSGCAHLGSQMAYNMCRALQPVSKADRNHCLCLYNIVVLAEL